AEVPLANDRRGIPGLLECLCERSLFQWQAVPRPRSHDAHLKPVPHRIASGHECRPRRAADRLNIERIEFRPGAGQLVNMRGVDLLTVHEPAILAAEVV